MAIARAMPSASLKGALIPIAVLTRGLHGSVRLVRNPGTVPMMGDGSLMRSGGETWGPVSPNNVQERGVSPDGQSGRPSRPQRRGRSRNSKKDLVTGPIRGLCALQARWKAFRQCPGCGFDFASGEGERSCSWGDCPYLPVHNPSICRRARCVHDVRQFQRGHATYLHYQRKRAPRTDREGTVICRAARHRPRLARPETWQHPSGGVENRPSFVASPA